MLKHYFTIAFRNLLKYKVQSVISIIGLTIGLTCFSLSMLWKEYESSYDNFHSKADRIYQLRGRFDNGPFSDLTEDFRCNKDFLNDLKSKFPQIEEATFIGRWGGGILNGNYLRAIAVDRSFFRIFDVVEPGFQYDGSDHKFSIITNKIAEENFPNEEAIGRKLKVIRGESTQEKEVLGVIKSWSTNTNINFDLITPINENDKMNFCRVFLLLQENTDLELFNELLANYQSQDLLSIVEYKLEAISIKDLRKELLNKSEYISYNSISKFAFVGILIIVCATFNYLILLVSRIKMRARELALRKVNGATDNSFLLLFGTDILVILLFSLLLTFFSLHLILSSFREFSRILLDDTSIYLNAFVYCCFVIISIMSVALAQIHYFKRRTIRTGLIKETKRDRTGYFYKLSVFLQLLISFGLILSTSLFIKQMNYLGEVDLGFKWKNIARVSIDKSGLDLRVAAKKIESLPHVKKVLLVQIALWGGSSVSTIQSWDGKADDEQVAFNTMTVSHDFYDFHGLSFIEGEAPTPEMEEKNGNNICYINEAAAKYLGWYKAVGKIIDKKEVMGVFKDYLIDPRKQAEPIIFRVSDSNTRMENIMYEYDEMYKNEIEKSVLEILNETYSTAENVGDITYLESYYKYFFISEEALLKILKIATVVCIIISIFGIYSMISLICTKRRKEIAIRKVNGASVRSIFHNLLKEQLILVLIAALIAFPIVYKIMKTWIEGYIKQTEISWWIFVFVLITILIIVTMTVFSQVWRAARQNPAVVIKSE